MELDVAAVRGIAEDLERSAQSVNSSTQRVANAGQEFDATAAGADYRSQGNRISQALTDVAAHLYGWANCTNDTAGVLGHAVNTNVSVDQTNATNLNKAQETLT